MALNKRQGELKKIILFTSKADEKYAKSFDTIGEVRMFEKRMNIPARKRIRMVA